MKCAQSRPHILRWNVRKSQLKLILPCLVQMLTTVSYNTREKQNCFCLGLQTKKKTSRRQTLKWISIPTMATSQTFTRRNCDPSKRCLTAVNPTQWTCRTASLLAKVRITTRFSSTTKACPQTGIPLPRSTRSNRRSSSKARLTFQLLSKYCRIVVDPKRLSCQTIVSTTSSTRSTKRWMASMMAKLP